MPFGSKKKEPESLGLIENSINGKMGGTCIYENPVHL